MTEGSKPIFSFQVELQNPLRQLRQHQSQGRVCAVITREPPGQHNGRSAVPLGELWGRGEGGTTPDRHPQPSGLSTVVRVSASGALAKGPGALRLLLRHRGRGSPAGGPACSV